MTIRQCDRLGEVTSQLGVAAMIGSAGDAMITGLRYGVDGIGLCLSGYLIWLGFFLTGRIPSDTVEL